jgi:hypothetical protein
VKLIFTRHYSTAQEDGIVAWDCLFKEEVLLLPWAHAFQGDNPMQSEFSSHIGMGGRYFCRICHVSGLDGKSRAPGRAGEIAKVTEFMQASTFIRNDSVFCFLTFWSRLGH